MGAVKWYAVMTNPNRELLAQRMIHWAKVECLYPHYLEWKRIDPKTKRPSRWIRKPLFARYIFVQAELQDLHRVNEAMGVSSVVSAGKTPFPLPQRFVEELTKMVDPTGCVHLAPEVKRKPQVSIGQRVQFIEGSPFWGFVAEVKRVMGTQAELELRDGYNKLGRVRAGVHQLLPADETLDTESPKRKMG